MTANTVRVVVADDHRLFRSGLIELLRSVDGIEVVAEAGTGEEALDLAREHTPDVVTLDVGMPGPEAAVTITMIREASPTTQVVVITMFDEPTRVHQLIAAGASAYLLKSASRAELATVVKSALSAEDLVFVAMSRQAFAGLAGGAPSTRDPLSPREAQILALLADAKSNREISRVLDISDATVKRHLSNIYGKLGAKSRMDAVLAGRSIGIISN